MSKYIKLEDAIHNINLEVIGRKEYTGDMKANLFFALDDLPTIEVSEDCISRKWLDENAEFYSQGLYNESAWAVPLSILDAAPSVIPSADNLSAVGEGEWIRTGRTNIYGGIEVQCSNCGDKVMVQHLEDEWYCRHCGADMGTKGADNE